MVLQNLQHSTYRSFPMLISSDKISKNTNLMEEREFFHLTILEI